MPLDTPKYALKDSAYARCAKAKAEQALAYGIAITSALGLVVAVFGILIWGGHGNPGMFVFGIAMWVTPLLVASTLSNLLDTFWIER